MRGYISALLVCLIASNAVSGVLVDLDQSAELNNPSLTAAGYRGKIAEAQTSQARSSYLPQISANASISKHEQELENGRSLRYDGQKSSITVQQAIFDKYSLNKIDESSAIESVYALKLKEIHQSIRKDILFSYLDAALNMEKLSILKQQKINLEGQLEQIKSRYKLQLAKVTDVYQAEAEVARLTADVTFYEQQLNIFLRRLYSLSKYEPILKMESISPILHDRVLLAVDSMPFSTLLNKTRENPKLLALSKEIEAAAIGKDAAFAKHYPTVYLGASIQKSNTGYEDSPSSKTTTSSLSLNLSVPLYSGGQTDAKVREASHRQSLAQAEYNVEEQNLEQLVQEAYSELIGAKRQFEAKELLVKSSEKAYSANQRGYELGVVTINDVLLSQNALSKVIADKVDINYQILKAKLNLAFAVGLMDYELVSTLDKVATLK
ncbi:TolC family protein [Balneatrix alpica]|uniref:TolC family protein n=1 Tax=Balneatrix alpica TaxID=75684 RepID=A0ABV5ZF59_9GAMM|nr:TolC family protein [Balneatrix alpica]